MSRPGGMNSDLNASHVRPQSRLVFVTINSAKNSTSITTSGRATALRPSASSRFYRGCGNAVCDGACMTSIPT